MCCSRVGELVAPAVAAGARVWLLLDCSFVCAAACAGRRGAAPRRSNVDRTRGGRMRERALPGATAAPCGGPDTDGVRPRAMRTLGCRADSSSSGGGACTVVTASTGEQAALDVVANDGRPHGAFTLCLDRALRLLLAARTPHSPTAAHVLADTREQLALLAAAVDLPLHQVPSLHPPENSTLPLLVS